MDHRIPIRLIPAFALGLLLTTCAPSPTTSTTIPVDMTLTAALPAGTPGPTGPTNTDGAGTIFIPGGTYPVGSSSDDLAALPDEFPQHYVTLTAYSIYTHEVTNEMYQACVTAGTCPAAAPLPEEMFDYASNPSFAPFPVVNVDWNMADTYCEWAGGRLPTEAEWEVAARGEKGNIYPWGSDTPTCNTAGFQDCAGGIPLPFMVGYFALGNSPWGAWDMAGNVWEWVNDWYEPSPYTKDPVTNPIGPWSGEYKVLRGGGWNSSAESLRSAMRLGTSASDAYWDVGFRCVPNGLPVPEAINSTSGGHTVRESGGGTLEGGGESGGESGGTSRGRFTWRFVSAACTPSYIRPDENLLAITLEVTETPSPFLWLYVNGEAAPIGGNPIPGTIIQAGRLPDLPEGTPLDIRLQIVNLDGSPIPWATASFTIPMPPPCGATQAPPRHASMVMCSVAPGSSQMFVQVSAGPTMLNYERISVNGVDAVELAQNPRSTTVGRLPDGSVTAGPGTMHILASSTDGTIHYDWTDAVTIPDCSSTSNEPVFTLTPTCNGAGGYTVDVRVTPADFPIRNFEMNDGYRFGSMQTGMGQYRILEVPAEVFSLGGGYATIWVVPGTMIGGREVPARMLIMPEAPACPEVPSTGEWNLRVVCDTDHPGSNNVWAAVDHPGDLNGLTWATMGGETNYVNMFSSGDPTPFRDYFDVPPSGTGALRVCIDPSGTGNPSTAICHTFDNFESLRTAAACGAPAGEEWAMNITCSSANPTEAYDIRLTYPAAYEVIHSNILRVRGGSIGGFGGGEVDLTTHSILRPNLQQNLFTPGDELLLRINIPGGGDFIEHSYGDVGSSLPACGGDTGDEPSGDSPGIVVSASCSTSYVGTYDLDIQYTPPDYQIYGIYDEDGRALTNCEICSAGHCLCQGVPTSPDGLIHINVAPDPEVLYPQVIAPPSCNGQSTGGWGLNASCSATTTDTIDLTITYPTTLGILPAVINTQPGWECWMTDLSGSGNTINCRLPVSARGSGPLTWEFTGPAPDYATIHHTFTEYDSVVPATCQGGSTTGWSIGNPRCHQNGNFVLMNIYYPPTLPPFTSLNVTAGSITFTCTDLRTSTPYRLACWGAATSSPAPLQVYFHIQTDSGPIETWITVPEWPTLAPRVCPTPVPGGTTPQPPPPPACSTYTAGLECENAGCYWWGAACHAGTDPCNAYNGNKDDCTINGCSWKDPVCSTP
jgi:formylglycine-generating enzyme required for sulfatase activity